MIMQRKENQFRVEQGSITFIGTRTDPYGFWTVKGRKGKDNIVIEGEYTSSDDALKAVERKLNDLNVTIEEKIV